MARIAFSWRDRRPPRPMETTERWLIAAMLVALIGVVAASQLLPPPGNDQICARPGRTWFGVDYCKGDNVLLDFLEMR